MKRSYEMDLCSGPLLSKILLFSLPLILSGVLQLLFNATDIVVVGKFAGSNAMAAVGSTTSLFNLLVNSFIGISVGANVLVARHYGERDYDGVQQTIQTALLTGLIGGAILIVLGVVLARPMLTLMATPDEVIDQAVLYMQVYFIGMPATMIYNFGAAVLRAVGDTGVERIFFTSSHPKDLLPETIDAMAETPAVMPQLHLAVQSGSTRILKEMNRRYTREDYLGLVDRIRNRMPDIALSTDIIVGFPGETEEDFEQTLSLAETVRYAQAYTFIYSKRAGTPAAEIDDPTPHEVILERFNRLVKVIETTAHEYNQVELHTVVPALIEGTSKKNDAVLLGKSPKNQTVHAPIPEGYSIDQLVGKIVDVNVDVAKTWYLSGSVVGEPR